jgi:hypothetical protein
VSQLLSMTLGDYEEGESPSESVSPRVFFLILPTVPLPVQFRSLLADVRLAHNISQTS